MKKQTLLLVSIAVLAAAVTAVAQQLYTYRCSRDGVTLQSTSGQPPRCPSDGTIMSRVLF